MLRGDATMDERIEKTSAQPKVVQKGQSPGWTRPDVPEVVLLCLWATDCATGAIVSHR